MTNSFYNKKYFSEHNSLDLHLSQIILDFSKQHHLKKILDVGCGTGKLVKYLNQHKLQTFGCDTHHLAIKYAKKINKNKITKASAAKLPYKSKSFDMITAISLIEHLTLSDINKFLKETKRILKPKGYIFLVTPNTESIIKKIVGPRWFGYKDKTHINFFSKRTLSIILKSQKYKNISTQFPITYDLPFYWNLPKFTLYLPKFIKFCLNYLMISSPMANYRDSLWLAAQK